MAFGFDDPFGNLGSPFGQNLFAPAARAGAGIAASVIPREQLEQEVGGLAGGLGGGLSYIGSSLNKAFGGRAIRSLLGAATTGDTSKLRDVLSIIPFSDKLGITDPTQETTGKELLGYGKNDDSWGGFLGGLGTEILTDPGTFLNPFGKTITGVAAAKAGVLPKVVQPIGREAGGIRQLGGNLKNLFLNKPANYQGSMAAQMAGISDPAVAAEVAAKMAPGTVAADVVDKPLRALANFRIPFTNIEANIGTGKAAQNIANNLGSIGDYLAYSPAGRAVTPYFDNRLEKFGPAPSTEIGQRTVRRDADALAAMQPDLAKKFLEQRAVAEKLGMTDPAKAAALNAELTRMVEEVQGKVIADPAAQALAASMRGEYDASRPIAAAAGREAKVSGSDYGNKYAFRQTTEAGEKQLSEAASKNLFSPKTPQDMARDANFDLPGGQDAVNRLFQDPLAALGTQGVKGLGGQGLPAIGRNFAQAKRHILNNYFGWNPAVDAEYFAAKAENKAGTLTKTSGNQYLKAQGVTATTANPQQLAAAEALDRRWAEYQLRGREWEKASKLPAIVAAGVEEPFKKALAAPGANPAQAWSDLFTTRPAMFADNPVGLIDAYRKNEALANTAAGGFSDILSTAAKRGANVPGERVSVAELLKGGQYDNDNMRNLLLDRFRQGGLIGAKDTEKILKDLYVPADVARDLTKYGAREAAKADNPLMQLIDSATNLNKASQTTLFPFTIPTALRNLLTEVASNTGRGAFGTGEGPIMNFLRPYLTARELRSGGAAPGLTKIPMFAGKTPEEATRLYRELAYQTGHDIPFEKFKRMELVGRGAHDSGKVGTLGPLAEPQKKIMQMAREGLLIDNPNNLSKLERLNPLNIRGVAGREETINAPVLAAQEMMHAVDSLGRHAGLIGQLSQGHNPIEAAARAKWMRMGADDLSSFERKVMTRAIPYYRWLRTAVPSMLGDVAAHPGGMTGQMIRGSNALRENEGFMPDYLGDGLAIPIGERTPEGHQRYLSRFGLPFEELGKLASTGAHPWQRTMQQLAGNLNPLLKNPIEFMTGTQLYSGRHVDDLYNRSGFDQLLGMTPLMTPFRFGSRLLDERKNPLATIAQLASPANLTDADMNRALIVQGRKILESELSTNPMIRSFSRPYVPDEFRGQLSPQDQRVLDLYNTLRSMAREQFAGGRQ